MDTSFLLQQLHSLPVVASPMFLASGVDLVVAQCKAGVVGTFPALNARPAAEFDRWIDRIKIALAAHDAARPEHKAAPFGVNLILHKTNDRLQEDLEICARQRVPIVITSVGNPAEVVKFVHGYGGLVFHDVINQRHARKAAAAGVDGLILVCAGAGGHAGRLSPFALVGEVRRWYQGLVILGGAISRGRDVLAARAMGADLAYVGTRFLATPEASIQDGYRQAIVEAGTEEIVYTDIFSGVHANFLRSSIKHAGLDADHLPARDAHGENFGSESMHQSKVWRDIWTAGHGVGSINAVLPTGELVRQMRQDYAAARAAL